MGKNNITQGDFKKREKDAEVDPMINATHEVLKRLNECVVCTHFHHADDGDSCRGLPAQVILVPNPNKKKIVVAGGKPAPEFTIRQVYPGRRPDDKPCALFDPEGMAALMIDLTKRFTFFPETLTDEDRQFIADFREHNGM